MRLMRGKKEIILLIAQNEGLSIPELYQVKLCEKCLIFGFINAFVAYMGCRGFAPALTNFSPLPAGEGVGAYSPTKFIFARFFSKFNGSSEPPLAVRSTKNNL